jgi:hypothetical protein
MITKITSKRVELPAIWLVENQEDWDALPAGLPRIIGTQKELSFIRVFLEFQVLYRSCLKTGLSIKWMDCLSKLGYKNLKTYQLESGGTFTGANGEEKSPIELDAFIEDQYLVNFDKLTELKVLPTWLDDLRTSIETNIIDEVTFNPGAFNKQLGMNIGGPNLKHNKKNLLILDVSGSMPDGVVKTITNLAKLMSKRFFADVIVTGGQSYFYHYEDVQNINIVDEAAKAGRNNEGEMYRKILKEVRDYGTIISFGDDDNPGYYTKTEDVCNFTCETLFSLHTKGNSTTNVTGYARCFKPKTTTIVKDWINTISN